MEFDRNSYTPLYVQLMDVIRDGIRNSKFSPDQQIPSERELMQRYNLNQVTVAKALGELVHENLLYRIQGKGTFVKKFEGSKLLGLVVPTVDSSFHPAFVRGVEDIASQRSYSVILCNTDNDSEKEDRYIQDLVEKDVEAIIVAPEINSLGREYYNRFMLDGKHLLLCDNKIRGVETDFVGVNNLKGAYLGTKHLIELGYKRIGFLGGPLGVYTSEERLKGFRKAFKERRLEIKPELVKRGGFSEESGYEMIKEFLDMKNRPKAFFSVNSRTTVGALRAVVAEGIQVPDELVIVSFDDVEFPGVVPLTVVAQPKYEIGKKAAEMLFERIENDGSAKPKEILLQPELIIRESSKRPGYPENATITGVNIAGLEVRNC